MSEGEGTMWDAPNQQVVRDDHSPPWEEGTGGSPSPPDDAEEREPTVDEMTKAQLLAYAVDHDIDVDESLTKAEIREAIKDA
jgi:hypothetical protein